MPMFILDPNDPFPPPELAGPDGLLAVGGDLSPERIIRAYKKGIFPWYNPGEPVLWWSPDPRCVLEPECLHVSRRLMRTIRQARFTVTFDTAFDEVITSCAAIRLSNGTGTWLTPEMILAYKRLHAMGLAHSVEAWDKDVLAGGLYGIALGQVFFGESMFTRIKDASKVAFVTLVQDLSAHGFRLIDCQVRSDHLLSFGAKEISREDFHARLNDLLSGSTSLPPAPWHHIIHGNGQDHRRRRHTRMPA
ncbi:MAG: leucyl/phenylalanyl-tRNA--protein transferase [Deltaproteobacteria bacterium]